jgi:hypothetical protein
MSRRSVSVEDVNTGRLSGSVGGVDTGRLSVSVIGVSKACFVAQQ